MSAPTKTSAKPAIKLASLQGRAVSSELLADLRTIAELPEPARERLWEVLGPCLGEALPDDIDARVERFCAAYGATAGPLGDAVSAVRALIRGASAADLSSKELAEDIARLPGGEKLAALLVPRYDAAKAVVRGEIMRASLSDHGRVLDGVDWRIETISASSRGQKLDLGVASLTLRYRKGRSRGRITLQLTRDKVAELQGACARLLEEPKRPASGGERD